MAHGYRRRPPAPGLLLHVALLLAFLCAGTGAAPAGAWGATAAGATTIGAGPELGVVTNAVSRRHIAPHAPIYPDLLAGSGARWVREEFRWDLVEPERGRFAWAAHDGALAAYREHGFAIIGLLTYSAGWAVQDPLGSSPNPPPWEEWAGYVTATVGRYRDSVAVWEIWNEPDTEQYWRGNARLYAGLLHQTAALIRRADPDAIVISGGVGDIGGGMPFLEEIGAAGGLQALDGIGLHPYLDYRALLGGAYRERDIERLRAFQARFGRPFWITEFGFSSLIEGGGAAGEAAQAVGLVRQIVETAASGLDVRAMVVYDAADDGQGPQHSEHAGLFRHDGRTLKPAFGALQTLARELGGLRAARRLPVEDAAVTRYRFERGDGLVTEVAWTDGAARRIAVEPVGAVQVADLFGARSEAAPALGQAVVAVGARPLYLTYRPAPDGARFIAESGHTLSGAFLDEWTAAGGLAALGLPLSEPIEERGNTWIQFFERGRLEFDGAMRWGLTGAEIAARYPAAPRAPLRCTRWPGPPRLPRGEEGYAPLPPCPADGPAARYFPETGHLVANGMLAFWEARGGLRRFGLPLSEEFDDAGSGLRLQLFERARLEYHRDTGAITIGRTGAEAMEARRAEWPLWPASPVGHDPARRYIAQARHTLTPRAAEAWARFGGADGLGLPLSEEYPLDGAAAQLFERGRIVWAADGTPSLAPVGAEHAVRQTDPAVRAALAPYACRAGAAPADPTVGRQAGDARPRCPAEARLFPETRHTLRGRFLAYWSEQGGADRFGAPISEEFALDGRVAQYFERARFELGPEGEVRLTPVVAELIGR